MTHPLMWAAGQKKKASGESFGLVTGIRIGTASTVKASPPRPGSVRAVDGGAPPQGMTLEAKQIQRPESTDIARSGRVRFKHG